VSEKSKNINDLDNLMSRGATPPVTRGGVRTSDTTTRGIRIEVQSMYMPERSVPKDGQYLFEYQVRISNTGSETAQLISREWIITNADGEVERVKGPGVVGEQPVLSPGGSFEYRSFCPLKTPVGSMHGSYQMITAQGDRFDAIISPFTLAVPNSLN
jgi:ApaG protein